MKSYLDEYRKGKKAESFSSTSSFSTFMFKRAYPKTLERQEKKIEIVDKLENLLAAYHDPNARSKSVLRIKTVAGILGLLQDKQALDSKALLASPSPFNLNFISKLPSPLQTSISTTLHLEPAVLTTVSPANQKALAEALANYKKPPETAKPPTPPPIDSSPKKGSQLR